MTTRAVVRRYRGGWQEVLSCGHVVVAPERPEGFRACPYCSLGGPTAVQGDLLAVEPPRPEQAVPRARLADVAHARRTDLATSHAAAASITDLRPRQFAVLRLLRERGPMTDEQIAAAYVLAYGDARYLYPNQSPSGLRTRRSELTAAGHVEATDLTLLTASGRRATVWKATT